MEIYSDCCRFNTQLLPAELAYCYACRSVHHHEHLDLRRLKTVLRGRILQRHNVNVHSLQRDKAKYEDMERGDVCSSLAIDVEARCEHDRPISLNGKIIRLHTCHTDTSVSRGLDFTVDVCNREPHRRRDETKMTKEELEIREKIARHAAHMGDGLFVRFNPQAFAFEGAIAS